MMIALVFLLFAIAKQYDYAVKIFETKKLDTLDTIYQFKNVLESRRVSKANKRNI